jgi:hypothetical protein
MRLLLLILLFFVALPYAISKGDRQNCLSNVMNNADVPASVAYDICS